LLRRLQTAVTLGEDPVRPSLDAARDRNQQTVHQPARQHPG
jgi:hypothetical protein